MPSVSAWAFGGAKPGETSDLFDADDGYYLARLDSLIPEAEPTFEPVKDDVRAIRGAAEEARHARPAARGSSPPPRRRQSLEAAAAAQKADRREDADVHARQPRARRRQLNEAIGAAFALPAGAVSQPIKIDAGVYVIRVDRASSRRPRGVRGAEEDPARTRARRQLRQQRVQTSWRTCARAPT